jgi:hypothetical protein
MKKLQTNISILMLSTLSLISCKMVDIFNPESTNVSKIVRKGDWRITLYSDNGKDARTQFKDFTISFSRKTVTATKSNFITFTNTNSKGSVTEKKSSISISGTYSTKYDDNKNKLILGFGTADPFDKLNDEWVIEEETSTKIRLQKANGSPEFLTLVKN